MERQFQRILNLAKKTGDRLIIYNSAEPESILVVMPLEAYEKILVNNTEVKNLTENQLLDKINRDIAVWKSEQNAKLEKAALAKDFFSDSLPDSSDFLSKNKKEEGEIPDFFINQEIKTEEKLKKKKHWQIPKDRKEAAEEVIEEDRQYLEEVRY